jgi:hypothetical protein
VVLWSITWEAKLWMFSVIFVLFGLYQLAKQELIVCLWTETQGTILESETVQLESESEFPSMVKLTVRVRYRYVVNGQVYESDRLTIGQTPRFSAIPDVRAFRKQYPPGSPVTVRYAPYAPSQATLIAERNGGVWFLPGMGVLFLVLAVYTTRKRRRRREDLHPDVHIPLPWP